MNAVDDYATARYRFTKLVTLKKTKSAQSCIQIRIETRRLTMSKYVSFPDVGRMFRDKSRDSKASQLS